MSTAITEETVEQKVFSDAAVEAVSRGVAWLDENVGIGWEDRIDLDSLAISSCRTCVLGQLFGTKSLRGLSGFLWACDHFPEISENMHAYGFAQVSTVSFRELTACWKNAIQMR